MVCLTSTFLSTILASSTFFSLSYAHPGHDVEEEARERRSALDALQYRSLSHCAEQLKARGLEAQALARRGAAVNNLRIKRSITLAKRSDVSSTATASHHSTEQYTPKTADNIIFAGNNSCILTPEVTEGPYYVTGEYVRQDITDKEEGVPLTIDIQIINTATCEPFPSVMLDFWHCNSTGVYSGVVANGNGNSNDETNLDNTALRGIQSSNDDGVVTFDTVFPGHYTGRTTHIHVMAHLNSTLLPNKTITAGTIAHAGQIFFDESLISKVEKTLPYSTNTASTTLNTNDSIFKQEAETGDPVVNYVFLDDSDISKGVFAWIAFGIDPAYSREVSAAAYLDESGGHANANAGGGGGGPGGAGGPPGGMGGPSMGTAMPTGTGVPSGMNGTLSTSAVLTSATLSSGAGRVRLGLF